MFAVLVISLAACGNNGRPPRQAAAAPVPSCAEMAQRIVEEIAPEHRPKMADILRRQCTEEGWTVENRRCVAGAASLEDRKLCFGQLTKAQQDAPPTLPLAPPPHVEEPLDLATSCTGEGYSYQDLKLVGIVSHKGQRKALLLDSTNLGYITKLGDCVGKEKAVLKEISKESITFEIHPEMGASGPKRDPVQRTVQLYPKQIPGSSPPSSPPPPPTPPR